MAEFALTLPILLLLMFGVIEFARIFHAWVTLQNSARQAARYAVTGRWDEESVIAMMAEQGYVRPGTTGDQLRDDVLNDLVPCVASTDSVFYNHWGHVCEPGDDDDQGLRVDLARLPSIVERARIGAASLSVKPGDRIVGLNDADGDEFNSETVGDTQPGWFHVWICSSRPPMYDDDQVSRYKASDDRNDRLCEVTEGVNLGSNQYDAGGPGDAVEIVVFFNHPLITPLGLVEYVQLQARRVMINESFRSTRVVNLPPQLALPTFTPSRTPLPSNTPLPSDTPTPTNTPTKTFTPPPTDTTTPTPTPDCNLVTLNNVRMVDNYLQLGIRNDNAYAPVFITRVELNWSHIGLYPGMYTDEMRIVGRSPFWRGPDYNPPTIADNTNSFDPTWNDDAPNYTLRKFDANTVTTWQVKFSNGPSRLSDYYTLGHFAGTRLYFGTEWGGVNQDCVVELTGYPTPTPSNETPTDTPTPICTNYEVEFVSFETNGVVHYVIRNTDVALAYITGFTINWNTYGRTLPAILLDFVSVGGSNAFDPAAVIIWDGSDNSSPAIANDGDAAWRVNAAIEPGDVIDVWLDFDGTSGRLDTSLGYFVSDFNGTSFEINFDCDGEPPDVPTPVNTQPPTATFTPSITPTPSKTNTPGPTNTPRPTNTPAPTRTPSNTPPPSNTPFNTPRPTDTPASGFD